MPNRSTEASISVTAISMLLRTRNLVIGNLGSGISAALTSWERGLYRPQLPTPGSQLLAQVPLPDVPRVAVGGVLRLPVSQSVGRRGHVGTEVQRHRWQLFGHQQLQRVHRRLARGWHQGIGFLVDELVGRRVAPARIVLAAEVVLGRGDELAAVLGHHVNARVLAADAGVFAKVERALAERSRRAEVGLGRNLVDV